jgi:lipoate---protein ligase
MAETWRELPLSAGPIDMELAGADGLLAGLRAGAGPTVRWYTTERLGLVLGAGQRLAEADTAALASLGASLHKRASGGTAVLFVPGFLMQDIALPAGHPLHHPDVTTSYRWLGEAWVATLARLGIASRLIEVGEARADTAVLGALERRACFGGRSPYEVLAAERKLVGFSQIRRREGAILQVGLYTHWEPDLLADLLALSFEERSALTARLAERVAGMAEFLPELPPTETVIAAFRQSLSAMGIDLTPGAWTAEERAARTAAQPRYLVV